MNEYYNTKNWKVLKWNNEIRTEVVERNKILKKYYHSKPQGLSIEELFDGVYFSIHTSKELFEKEYNNVFKIVRAAQFNPAK